nr:hypothetical protein [Tanacetum cinerariifolium]
MDDPNTTMEEYIRLEEEKARRRDKFLTGKLLRMVRSVSSLNDEIYLKVSLDDSDDEDYTPLFRRKHIDEFDLNDETSLSEYDEEEQYNFIPFDPKRYYKDGDYALMLRRPRIEGLNFYYLCAILVDFADMAPLPPCDQRYSWIRYQDLAERVRMVYTMDDGHEVFVSHAWRRLFEIRAPLVWEFILEFFSTCKIEDEIGLDYLFRHAEGRKSDARLSGGPERQQVAAVGALRVTKDAPAIDKGDQAILAPVQAPQQPPPTLSIAARTIL